MVIPVKYQDFKKSRHGTVILTHDHPPTLTELLLYNDGAPNLNEVVNLTHHDPFLDQRKLCVYNRLVKHRMCPADWVKHFCCQWYLQRKIVLFILDFENATSCITLSESLIDAPLCFISTGLILDFVLHLPGSSYPTA